MYEAVLLTLRFEVTAHEKGIPAVCERKVDLLQVVERESDDIVAHEVLVAVAYGFDSLAVVDVLAVVYSSHRVNQYAYGAAVRAAVKIEGVVAFDFVLVAAVYFSLGLAVDVDIRRVVDVGNAQAVRIIYLLKLRFIVDHAAVLTEIFHALGQGNAVALTEIVEIAHNRGALTERHETGRAQPWKVSDAPADYIDGMLKAIVGFALPIERLIGKRKLSQNRSAADIAGVREGLAASLDVRDQTLARFMPKEPV